MYSKIDAKFWSDEKVLGLSIEARYLMLYLLTTEHRNTIGCYRLPKAYAAEDTGLPAKTAAKAWKELLASGMVAYDDKVNIVLVRNFMRYDPLDNPNKVKAAVAALTLLPRTKLLLAPLEHMQRQIEADGKSFLQPLADAICNHISNDATIYNVRDTEPLSEGLQEPLPEPLPISSTERLSKEYTEPLPEPLQEPIPEGYAYPKHITHNTEHSTQNTVRITQNGDTRDTGGAGGDDAPPGADEGPDAPPAEPAALSRPVRHKYGQYANVLLSDEDLDKLQGEFPDWQERVERLSAYIASTGKSYKNHLATIRNWARMDAERGPAAAVKARDRPSTLDVLTGMINGEGSS